MSAPRVDLGPVGEAQERLLDLAARLGIVEPLTLGKDAHGRPTARAGDRVLAYSRSRARGLCAQALAPSGRVGIDLVDPAALPPEGLLDLCSVAERRWVPPNDPRLQARAWAAKEAVLKALGLGLGFGLESIELGTEAGGTLRIARIAGLPPDGWHLAFPQAGGLVLAVAWTA